jgi:hypothetical protein
MLAFIIDYYALITFMQNQNTLKIYLNLLALASNLTKVYEIQSSLF